MDVVVFFLKRRVFHNSGKLLSKRKENKKIKNKNKKMSNCLILLFVKLRQIRFLRNLETSLDKVVVSVEPLL